MSASIHHSVTNKSPGATCRKRMKKNFYPIIKNKIFLVVILVSATLLCSSCRKTVKEYYASGKLMAEKQFTGKKLDGKFTLWYESGNLQQQASYRKDKLDGKMTRFYANGNKELEESFTNGFKNGHSLSWDEEGNLIEERTYVNDTLNGHYRMNYASGIPKIEGYYASGLYEGKWQYFSETGNKVGEGNFTKGSGVLTGYDSAGHKNREVNYTGNKKNGKEIRFNPDGSIAETLVYKEDKLVKAFKEPLANSH